MKKDVNLNKNTNIKHKIKTKVTKRTMKPHDFLPVQLSTNLVNDLKKISEEFEISFVYVETTDCKVVILEVFDIESMFQSNVVLFLVSECNNISLHDNGPPPEKQEVSFEIFSGHEALIKSYFVFWEPVNQCDSVSGNIDNVLPTEKI